uniref:Uncharacterized protein n=1 Tax=Romanomermis culicivorax TaxID=13658 RepID=A0A915IQG0_ROMCU
MPVNSDRTRAPKLKNLQFIESPTVADKNHKGFLLLYRALAFYTQFPYERLHRLMDEVKEAALPYWSTTDMWAVPWSHLTVAAP